MRVVFALAALALLSGCLGSHTGKALNALDYNEPYPLDSKSFWCSGNCEKPAGEGEFGSQPDSDGPSDAVSSTSQ